MRIFLIVILFVASSAAANIFNSVKILSDDNEKNLNSQQSSNLLLSQAKLGASGFEHCINNVQALPEDFTIVVRINLTGKIDRYWLDKESEFGACFSEYSLNNFLYKPPFQPFYTSFEYLGEPMMN